MSEAWTPQLHHRAHFPGYNTLDLLDGSRLDSGSRPEIRAYTIIEAGSCWVARFGGLDEAWMPVREFVQEVATSRREVAGAWFRESVYRGFDEGLYEARSWMHATNSGYRTIFFSFDRIRGFVLLSADEFRSLASVHSGVNFGDVRSLVAAGSYEHASRAANWLATASERDAARDYITSERERARAARALPPLVGADAAVAMAMDIRERAQRALEDHLGSIAEHVPDELSELARTWLIEKTSSSFWLEHRHELLQGGWIWEQFLSEITE